MHNSDGKYAIRAGIRSQSDWYFDSGATDHVTGDVKAFDYLEEIPLVWITVANKTEVMVTAKGVVSILLESGQEVSFLEVLYSPEFGNTCLLSVS
jgi:hypothetical protein